MDKIYPAKLTAGDEVRVIAPARSLSIISQSTREIANKKLSDLGLKLTFSKYVEEIDEFSSSSVESRINDLHQAFSDKNVKAVFTVIGGFNSNQLLKFIDWDLIKRNPKILSGYSDISSLNNALFAKTGLVTYSAPQYSTFGQKLYFDYTLDYFKKCMMLEEPFEIKPSESWSDDHWYLDQDNRRLISNAGWLVINEGEAKGTILGGNLCTFNLLQGTEYKPSLEKSLLFIEDDETSKFVDFDRNLQSLIHLPDFSGVAGIVIGRFQAGSEMTNDLLTRIIKTKPELNNIPVLANVDFGHTSPLISFPIGGTCKLEVTKDKQLLKILEH